VSDKRRVAQVVYGLRWLVYWDGDEKARRLQQYVGGKWVDVPSVWEGTGDDDTPP
jgi:hypothetical protein